MYLYFHWSSGKEVKDMDSFFLQLPPSPFGGSNTHPRHKDILFPLGWEHGSLSLHVSGMWFLWCHLPNSDWNAAVVGQLFRTPEIHPPRWHLPGFVQQLQLHWIYFICVYLCVGHIFYKEHFMKKKKLCLSQILPTILLWIKNIKQEKKKKTKRPLLSPHLSPQRARNCHLGKKCPEDSKPSPLPWLHNWSL